MTHHAFIHGHSKKEDGRQRRSPTYRSWESMRDRCTRPGCHTYKMYGGRGITVCERWNVFLNFLEDMGERPKGTTLDRIDGTKGYEPGNCRWATAATQGRNKPNLKLDIEKAAEIRRRDKNGERVGRLAKEFGVDHSLVSMVISGRVWREDAT